MKEKLCRICKKKKFISEFHIDGRCKICYLKEQYSGFFTPPELDGLIAELLEIPPGLDEWEKRKKVKRIERRFKKKEYQRKYPERYKAKLLVREALLKGQITKPEKCSFCGESGKIEAHHENYFEPLKVIWLCSQCHYMVHGSNFRYYQMHKIPLKKNEWLCHNCCRINSTKYDKCRNCGATRGVLKIRRNKRRIKRNVKQ